MRNISLIILCLCSTLAFCQEKLLVGKIIVKDATPAGVRILNLVSEKETVSDSNGNFSIVAKADDLLVFSAIHLDYMRHIVDDDDMRTGTLNITLTSHVNQLEEVDINRYDDINALALGILSSPAKKYTPAERRLKTATDLNMSANMGTMAGFSLSLDPLLNWMSGRTKMLKSDVLTEKREFALNRMGEMYDKVYYTDHLKIPAEFTTAFEYFCAEDEALQDALKKRDKLLSDFLMTGLARDYLERLNDGKK